MLLLQLPETIHISARALSFLSQKKLNPLNLGLRPSDGYLQCVSLVPQLSLLVLLSTYYNFGSVPVVPPDASYDFRPDNETGGFIETHCISLARLS